MMGRAMGLGGRRGAGLILERTARTMRVETSQIRKRIA